MGEVKNNNRNRVLNLVRKTENITKPNVSKELGLSLPTAIQHMKELEELGAIREGDVVGHTGGRRAKGYSLNENYRYAVGIELTLKEIVIIVVDFCGNQLAGEKFSCTLATDNNYYKMLGELLEQCLERWSIDRERIIGVGIAVPGLVTDDFRKIYYGKPLGVVGVLAEDLGRYIPYPCHMYNNSDAAGYAEILGDEHCKDAVLIRLEKEIGGSVMIDGKVYRGENGKSGKVGHIQLIRGGEECYCGRRGCFNTLCNQKKLEAAGGGSVEDFFAKLGAGDDYCQRVWEDYLQSLAEGITTLRMLFDSQVIIGGVIADYIVPCFEKLVDKTRRLDPFDDPHTYLRISKIGRFAPALGSAEAMMNEYWENF